MIAHAREEAKRIAVQSARDLEDALTRRQRLAEERIAQAETGARRNPRRRGRCRDRRGAHGHRGGNGQAGGALLDAAIAALPQRLR
jgi:F-type H+-transporting ATPase subunit b